MKQPTQRVRDYLVNLQDRITSTIAVVDGGSFVVDHWKKPAGERLQGIGGGEHQMDGRRDGETG